MIVQPQPGNPVPNAPRRDYRTIEGRYQTVWPALISVLWWQWTHDMFAGLYGAMPGARWIRGTLATLLGLLPAAGLLAGYLILISFVIIWPLAFVQMLPVRIGVHRHAGQYGAIWVLCFFAVFTLGVLWVIGLVIAVRDRPAPPVIVQPR